MQPTVSANLFVAARIPAFLPVSNATMAMRVTAIPRRATATTSAPPRARSARAAATESCKPPMASNAITARTRTAMPPPVPMPAPQAARCPRAAATA